MDNEGNGEMKRWKGREKEREGEREREIHKVQQKHKDFFCAASNCIA